MLGVAGSKVWPVSNFAQQLPPTRNNMQQGVQTDATFIIQQCWELLANSVASVCMGLDKTFSVNAFLWRIPDKQTTWPKTHGSLGKWGVGIKQGQYHGGLMLLRELALLSSYSARPAIQSHRVQLFVQVNISNYRVNIPNFCVYLQNWAELTWYLVFSSSGFHKVVQIILI